jgi:hypothetical protein
MTFNVYYTDHTDLDSSFVDQAWYDDTRNRLTLDLNGVVYEYYDVQKATYTDLVTAPSAGTFYRKNIQGVRHGQRLGYEWEANEVATSRTATQPVVDVTKAEEVHFHNGGYIRRDGSASFPNVKVGEVVVAEKDLTKVEKFPLATESASFFSDEPVKYNYTVQFVVLTDDDEESDERSHTLTASSLDDAIEDMLELAYLLDQDIVLKGASVRFD